MVDSRHQKLAQVLVNYSLALKPEDKVAINGSPIATPLIKEIYREAVRAGAYVYTQIRIEELVEIFLHEASDEQLTYISERDRFNNEYPTAAIHVLSTQNTKSRSGIDPKRIARSQAAAAPLIERNMARTAAKELRWCVTLFPTQAYAQDAGMSLSDYEDFVFGSMLLSDADPVESWSKVKTDQQHIVDYLNRHDEIHIVSPDTDVTYRAGGRIWINAHGDFNFPDGEVFTGPIEDSVNGTVRFTYPAVYNGQEVEDVRLTFRDGKVVESNAGRNERFLNEMLDMDASSRYLGEVAFGLNYGVKQFTKNILFDEKIGGTMHMALGASYPETGGKNVSALHWDMVCDLREGKVYADGELCYENGKFLI